MSFPAARAIHDLLLERPEEVWTYQELADHLGINFQMAYEGARLLRDHRVAAVTKLPRNGEHGRMMHAISLHPDHETAPTLSSKSPRSWRDDPAKVARAERMLDAYVHDGLTLEEVGRHHGLTRERVRQIITELDPTLLRLHKLRTKARTRLRAYVERGTPTTKRECRTCGAAFTTTARTQAYCSPIHHRAALSLRFQTDEDAHTRHRESVARWKLENDPRPVQRRYAQRVLAGEIESSDWHRANTHYLVPGSVAFHWAVRACSLGWPIFEQLHPDVQAQVRSHLVPDDDAVYAPVH